MAEVACSAHVSKAAASEIKIIRWPLCLECLYFEEAAALFFRLEWDLNGVNNFQFDENEETLSDATVERPHKEPIFF